MTRPTVTARRYYTGKLSQDRNAAVTGDDENSLDPNGCHLCREPFAAGQMRYPVMTSIHWSDIGLASICMECFAAEESTCDECDVDVNVYVGLPHRVARILRECSVWLARGSATHANVAAVASR